MAEKQDDLNLPAAVVTRIIKEALPEGCNIAKEAKLALTRAASVFVLYMTAQANNVAAERNKKTISDQDVFEALRINEFGRFEDDLKEALAQYRQAQKSKKDKKQGTSLDDSNRMDDTDDVDVEMEQDQEEEDEDQEPSASTSSAS